MTAESTPANLPPNLRSHNLLTTTLEPPLRFGAELFPQFEVLDLFGPLENLDMLVRLDDFPYKDSLSLAMLAETLDPVSSGSVKDAPHSFTFNPKVAQSIVPTHTFADAPEIDVLIIPGGYRTVQESAKRPVIEYLQKVFPTLKSLFSEKHSF